MNAPYEQQRDVLVRSVSRDELELRQAIEDLKSVARHEWAVTRERLDVKHQIAVHPAPWLMAAVAVGFWIGWSLDL